MSAYGDGYSHGRSGYKRGCRCDGCRAGQADYVAGQRARRAERDQGGQRPPPVSLPRSAPAARAYPVSSAPEPVTAPAPAVPMADPYPGGGSVWSRSVAATLAASRQVRAPAPAATWSAPQLSGTRRPTGDPYGLRTALAESQRPRLGPFDGPPPRGYGESDAEYSARCARILAGIAGQTDRPPVLGRAPGR